MSKELYDSDYYQLIQKGSLMSANVVAPEIMKLINPKTVIDIGCGTGTWLSVFKSLGCSVFGLDGSWVEKQMLKIDLEEFYETNLEEKIILNKTFDLVVSLEVGEHLKEERAESFISDLTSLGPVILFSAAVPSQYGRHHINEKWQSYWVEIFLKNNYIPIDCIRPVIWNNHDVEWWYKQNTILYCRKDYIKNYPKLSKLYLEITNWQMWDLVHPEMLKYHNLI